MATTYYQQSPIRVTQEVYAAHRDPRLMDGTLISERVVAGTSYRVTQAESPQPARVLDLSPKVTTTVYSPGEPVRVFNSHYYDEGSPNRVGYRLSGPFYSGKTEIVKEAPASPSGRKALETKALGTAVTLGNGYTPPTRALQGSPIQGGAVPVKATGITPSSPLAAEKLSTLQFIDEPAVVDRTKFVHRYPEGPNHSELKVPADSDQYRYISCHVPYTSTKATVLAHLKPTMINAPSTDSKPEVLKPIKSLKTEAFFDPYTLHCSNAVSPVE